MIEIKPLTRIEWEDLEQVMPGYTSTEKYAVAKTETPQRTVITIEQVALDKPYLRRWDYRAESDIDYLQQILREGLSLGAYNGDDLAGLAIAERHDWHRTLWIWEFGVAPAYRRQGLGMRLMSALAAKAAGAGLRIMVAETQNTNAPAIRFYRAAGFEIDALDLSYYTNHDVDGGEVAIFMKRKL
ncbi:MAG: GNAT family N-acetyltransferase [Anaerolineae bacterium]|nr:GNAT family N-acetyltransferase [Anaerolineae bacterium]